MTAASGPTTQHTPADWWVTADRASVAAREHLRAAESQPDLLHTLSEIGRAQASATIALGAAVNAMLASGQPWDSIATALDHPGAEAAQRHTAGARSDAHRALLARLDHHH
ncbi:hypothetical protein ACFVXG_15340 [Kitasatospora sp. NPDC058162]|uniref:hypothetical protein n=1 Tax=Kitasatospora sp. NPDC058162 TaxID=3346362 RepID=UPI0036D85D57